MLQPGRGYTATNSYRYGFNGKENDNEVKGEGNQQDYGMRIYDPRLRRFLSTDPLAKNFAWYSPYQFAGNIPIAAIDLDGGEQKIMINWYDVNGNLTRTRLVNPDFKSANNLYNSFKNGGLTRTNVNYTVEGTKFNSTNAHFTEGFEAYKKGTPTKTGVFIRPKNGTLTFDIKSTGEVTIKFDNAAFNERKANADAMRGFSKLANVVGTSVESLGYTSAAVPGGQTATIPLIGIGKLISSIGDLVDAGADIVEGETENLTEKGGAILGQAMFGRISKLIPTKKLTEELTKEAFDTYTGRGIGAIKDGLIDNKQKEVEKSDKLDLKIEIKKQ